MALIKLEPNRARIVDLGEFVTVTMPVPGGDFRAFSMVVLSVFLCLWVGIGSTLLVSVVWTHASTERVGAPDAFITEWLLLWALSIGWTSYSLAWVHAGRECVTVTSQLLSVQLRPLGRRREYRLGEVHNLRVQSVATLWTWYTKPGMGWPLMVATTTMAFEYRARTVRFGANVEGAEAARIVELIQARFGQYMGK